MPVIAQHNGMALWRTTYRMNYLLQRSVYLRLLLWKYRYQIYACRLGLDSKATSNATATTAAAAAVLVGTSHATRFMLWLLQIVAQKMLNARIHILKGTGRAFFLCFGWLLEKKRFHLLIAVYLRRKLTFTTTVFLEQLPHQFDALFNPKNTAETKSVSLYSDTSKYLYWSTWKTYELSRHRCCSTLDFGDNANHSYSHRFKPSATMLTTRIPTDSSFYWIPAFRKAQAQQRNYTGQGP